jgi:hypothetical protein
MKDFDIFGFKKMSLGRITYLIILSYLSMVILFGTLCYTDAPQSHFAFIPIIGVTIFLLNALVMKFTLPKDKS